MTDSDRAVYEKILAAHLASKNQIRLSPDTFLRALLTTGDRDTEAYATYDYLQGRSPEFAAFLVRRLGYSNEASAQADLDSKYGDTLNSRLERLQQTGR